KNEEVRSSLRTISTDQQLLKCMVREPEPGVILKAVCRRTVESALFDGHHLELGSLWECPLRREAERHIDHSENQCRHNRRSSRQSQLILHQVLNITSRLYRNPLKISEI